MKDERTLYLGDDGSYIDYVEMTVDPGAWMFLFTFVICLLTVVALPILVVLGQRYEKKRIMEEETALLFATKEEEKETDSPKRSKKSKRNQEALQALSKPDPEADLEANRLKDPEVTFRLPSQSSRKQGRRTDGSVVTRSTRASRKSGMSDNMSVATGMTNGSSYVHGRARSEVSGTASSIAWKNLVDKVIMPPYQDDEARSVLTRDDRTTASGLSRKSAATLNAATNRNTTYSSNFLDTRHTRRRSRIFNTTNDSRSRRTQKQSKREAIINPHYDIQGSSRRQGRGWSDTKSEIVGHTNRGKPLSSSKSVASEALTTQSQMTGRFSFSSNRSGRLRFGRKKRSSSPVSIAPSVMSRIEDDITPNDAADANDPGQNAPYKEEDRDLHIFCGKNAMWRPAILRRGIDHVIDIAKPDNETRRIVKLGIPFTLAVVMESVFENVELALVGNFIGTDELAAYAMADLLMGTTDEFIAGLYDAAMTVCPHAIGAGNNYLCGQYIQITCILYLCAQIPALAIWWYYISPAIQWFGLSKEIGDIAETYIRVAIFGDVIEELAEIYHGLLEITDHEAFSATIGIVEGLVGVTIITYMLFFYDLTLVEIAYIDMILAAIFFLITIIISVRFGWISAYTEGMFKNLALKNTLAVKNVCSTAWPLALGSLLAYGEWEVLTVFASYLGPAEVSAWAILGYLWETFEASTEGIGDGAEVRVAYHLGKGNPEMAFISAQKSILLGIIFATFITSIFFIIGDTLPTWFTTDPVLQHMIREMLPLVGLGNITMTFGMMCWAIIGAQGRYRLATLAAFCSSWSITMPLAAVMVYVFYFDLKGITSAVVIGYAVAGTVMSYIVLRSDWERLSKIIIELNQITGEIESSDSEGGYSSSSSSSDSSSSSESSDSDSD